MYIHNVSTPLTTKNNSSAVHSDTDFYKLKYLVNKHLVPSPRLFSYTFREEYSYKDWLNRFSTKFNRKMFFNRNSSHNDLR